MRSVLNNADPGVSGAGRALTAWVVAVSFAGCGGSGAFADVMDDSAYVEVMSELVSLRWQFRPRDSLAADSTRFVILRERGVTVEDLERFAVRHGSDPGSMAVLWELIAARADELAGGFDPESDSQLESPDSAGVRRP